MGCGTGEEEAATDTVLLKTPLVWEEQEETLQLGSLPERWALESFWMTLTEYLLGI